MALGKRLFVELSTSSEMDMEIDNIRKNGIRDDIR